MGQKMLLLFFLGLVSAQVTTLLTFSGAICGGSVCGNGASIDQSYGDLPGLDVQYSAGLDNATRYE